MTEHKITIRDKSEIIAMQTGERIAAIMELRGKMQATDELSDEEVQYGVRLMQAERVARAGGAGGSGTKKAQAQKTFDLSDF